MVNVQAGRQMEGTESKGLKGKIADEASERDEFSESERNRLRLGDKPVFLDLQQFDLRVQRGTGNSKFRGSAFWACYSPFAFR